MLGDGPPRDELRGLAIQPQHLLDVVAHGVSDGIRLRCVRFFAKACREGALKIRSPKPAIQLHVEGESPRRYFSRGSRLVVRVADRVLFDRTLEDDFAVDIAIPDGAEEITLETDQFYAPADRSRPWRKSTDQRHLGLRIYKCEFR